MSSPKPGVPGLQEHYENLPRKVEAKRRAEMEARNAQLAREREEWIHSNLTTPPHEEVLSTQRMPQIPSRPKGKNKGAVKQSQSLQTPPPSPQQDRHQRQFQPQSPPNTLPQPLTPESSAESIADPLPTPATQRPRNATTPSPQASASFISELSQQLAHINEEVEALKRQRDDHVRITAALRAELEKARAEHTTARLADAQNADDLRRRVEDLAALYKESEQERTALNNQLQQMRDEEDRLRDQICELKRERRRGGAGRGRKGVKVTQVYEHREPAGCLCM